MRLSRALLIVGLLILAACRIEDHTLAGTRRDEAAIREAIESYYRAVSARDDPSFHGLFVAGAAIDFTGGRVAAADSSAPARVEAAGPHDARVIRTDLRQSRDLAAVWVSVRGAGTARGEMGIDHFVLRRGPAGWRITHLSLTSVPSGVDP